MQLHCYRAEIQKPDGRWLTCFFYAVDQDAAKASFKRSYADLDPEQAKWDYQGEVRDSVIDADGWPVTQ